MGLNTKLPGWLIKLLLITSLASCLIAIAYYWVIWPEQTAHWFIDKVSRGEVEDTNTVLRNAKWICAESGATLFLKIDGETNSTIVMDFYPIDTAGNLGLRFEHRTLLERIIGRQRLVMQNLDGSPGHWMNGKAVHFVINRGVVEYALIRCQDESPPQPPSGAAASAR